MIELGATRIPDILCLGFPLGDSIGAGNHGGIWGIPFPWSNSIIEMKATRNNQMIIFLLRIRDIDLWLGAHEYGPIVSINFDERRNAGDLPDSPTTGMPVVKLDSGQLAAKAGIKRAYAPLYGCLRGTPVHGVIKVSRWILSI